MSKILILCPYFNRPLLVKNALRSILSANEHHTDWQLIFGDDGSSIPGRPIVEEILKDHLDKVEIVESGRTLSDKLACGLSYGKYVNPFLAASDAEAAIMLCDDDELVPTYLRDLSQFLDAHPETDYCYSNIHLYNPLFEQSASVCNLRHKWNRWQDPISPSGKLDASQVAWRLRCNQVLGVWFPDNSKDDQKMPWRHSADRTFFDLLYEQCGHCQPTNLIAQFKGVHDYQLVWHKNSSPEDLERHVLMCEHLAGVVL